MGYSGKTYLKLFGKLLLQIFYSTSMNVMLDFKEFLKVLSYRDHACS